MENYLGEIRYFAGVTAPRDWVFCDGRLLNISVHDELFNLIGTAYGGNGRTTFAVPDFRGRLPVGDGRNPRTGTSYVVGAKGGHEETTLTEANMPSHTHTAPLKNVTGSMVATNIGANFATPVAEAQIEKILDSTGGSPAQYVGTDGGATVPLGGITLKSADSPQTGSTGDTEAQPNIMPFTAINMIIALSGLFPSRS